jgi:hypothetical protein
VGNATKRVADIQPGKVKGARLASCIVHNGLEEESVFVATFAWASTLLLLGKEVIRDGESRHAFCDDGHQELVKTRHQSNGAEVASVGGGVLLVY